jgi:hypothetical protein
MHDIGKDTPVWPSARGAQQYWERANEAEVQADRAIDVAAERTWREVAAQSRELALAAERGGR